MSDTQGETWEKRQGEVLVPLNGDEWWWIVPVGWKHESVMDWPIAQCEDEAHADAIIRDHNRAATAEEERGNISLPFRRSKGVIIRTPLGAIEIRKGHSESILICAPKSYRIDRMLIEGTALTSPTTKEAQGE